MKIARDLSKKMPLTFRLEDFTRSGIFIGENMAEKLKIGLIENSQRTEIFVEEGTQVYSILENFKTSQNDIYGIKINNSICSLNSRLTYECDVEPILSNTKNGAEIYRRSLCFVLAAAAHKVCPEKRLLVGHSLGHGYYYTFDGENSVSNDLINALRKEMESVVAKNLFIKTKKISYQKAFELFEALGLKETCKQLDFNCPPHVFINTFDDSFADLYVSPLVLSTGVLKLFDLLQYKNGFLLRFPNSKDPDRLDLFVDQPKLYEIYEKYKEWGRKVDVTSVGSLNELVSNGKINDFIDITETYQQKNISKIASKIVEKGTVRVVLIAGPSSSGKTTSAKKLALELLAMGYKPKIISLDSYYAGHDKTPRDENGNPDFECLEALNIELLNQNLMDLFEGKEVTIPTYDFHSGASFFEEKNKMTLAKNELLILEGIHGLNDKLTPKVPKEYKFKIYLSALTQLNLDDHNRISTSDNRLIRRIVRDNNFRGKPAAGTIDMWASVAKGETLHIFPFQNNADAILNTALDYELAVLRVYAAPLLRQVKPTENAYGEARRLLAFLENFATIPSSEVPERSIIREFIGGSAFKY